MSKTFASLFSCAGCVDQLPAANGYTQIYANEYDDHMADIYEMNYTHTVDRRDFLDIEIPDIKLNWLHASPPCTIHSGARNKEVSKIEEEKHRQMTLKVHKFAMLTAADFVSIENVKQYYKSEMFYELSERMIADGYLCRIVSVSASEVGLPQSRVRGFALFYRELSAIPVLTNTLTRSIAPWEELIDISVLPVVEPKPASYPFIRSLVSEIPADQFPVWSAVVNYTKKYKPKPAGANVETIKAMIADDGKSKNGRSRYILIFEGNGTIRTMVAEELKKIQGFHPDFYLPENQNMAVRAIGNACPPQMLAKAINVVSIEV